MNIDESLIGTKKNWQQKFYVQNSILLTHNENEIYFYHV